MKRWIELKVYRNLDPTDVPKSFKTFAKYLLDKLQDESFYLIESKTNKSFIRITEDLQQVISFDNSSPWVKTQKEIHIDIVLNSLYTERTEGAFCFLKGYQLNKDFKMFYPLTQEFLLLADHLHPLLTEKILPFFEKYCTNYDLSSRSEDLLAIEGISGAAEDLFYIAAFRTRNEKLFRKYNEILIEKFKRLITLSNPTEDTEHLSKRIEKLIWEKEAFYQAELFNQEILNQDKIKQSNLHYLIKKRSYK